MADKEEATRDWIENVELPDANVKWGFSHFDGRADTFNDEGDHNFTLILPEETALELDRIGWNIKKMDPYEEGDPPEYLFKIKISYKYEAPMIYLIKGERKFRADEKDLRDIKRTTVEQLDVIVTPSRWVNGQRSGISAYVKEMYVKISQSRFAREYEDYEEV